MRMTDTFLAVLIVYTFYMVSIILNRMQEIECCNLRGSICN